VDAAGERRAERGRRSRCARLVERHHGSGLTLMQPDGNELREKHIGELISQLGTETATLVRKEMELARAELTQRVEAARDEVKQTLDLARAETSEKLDRAKSEMAAKGKQAGVGLGMFGAAGVGALLALGALTACLILLLDRWLPADLAALIVTVAWGLLAAIAALRGRDKVHEASDLHPGEFVPRRTIESVKDDLGHLGNVGRLKPQQTIETVKEDVEWAKTRIGSGER
jgi:hypothetical protein